MRLKSTGSSSKSDQRGERGAALVEFSIAALVFLTSIFAVLEFGRLLWVHNALTDAARRGARYAVTHAQADVADAQRMAVYGTTADGPQTPMVSGLTPGMVKVTHNNFGVGQGTVTVKIDAYDFNFVVPLVGTTIRMPEYITTLTAESAGTEPGPLP
ncbi:MAG TPA: TadE/TadG family type IV pilus assembly protein [Pyrinomonadaceae bacterium]